MPDNTGRRREDPDYGMGEHSIDCDKLGLIDEQELTDRLVRTFESPDYRPPRLPAVAMELLALAKDPDVEFHQLEELLEQDSMLAGEVLSLSRSAFYARSRRVDSLGEALILLGLDKLRQVVLQVSLNMRVFRCPVYRGCMEQLRYHCRSMAHLCRIVAHYTPIAEEQAFLCGLLHDVGFAGILLVLGDVKRGVKPPDLAVLWPAIDAAHARAGARMVELWELPAEISLAVGAHHQVSIDGFDHPTAATVCVAEALGAELGMGFIPDPARAAADAELDASGLTAHGHIDRTDAVVVARAHEALALSEQVLDLIREAAREWAETEAAPAGESA